MKKKWYVAITLEQQQQLCTGASRQPDGPWSHGDVTWPQVKIKLALCVFVILKSLLVDASFCPPLHDLYNALLLGA